MCGASATSREHVPPLCLFPEEKDIKTSIFRNNLITVPSCDLHNSKKSKDDEFLMASLAGIVGNNIIGFYHMQTKVKRAMERNSNTLMDAIMKDIFRSSVKDEMERNYPVLIGRPDLPRLHLCFTHIAHGIYYHKFGKRLEGKSHILIDFVTYEAEQSETYKLLSRKRFEMEPQKSQTEGGSPEIFNYEMMEPDEFGLIAMKMTFYEGATVFVAFQPDTAQEPSNLLTELIKSGIPVSVQFKDGSQFDLNKQEGEK